VRPAALLTAERLEAWRDLPHVLRDVFPDPTPEGIAAALDAYCRRALGAPIAGAEFAKAGVGSVHGLRLADGRRVVVKVHPPRSSPRHLEAMQAVQRHLAGAGFPAPEPLAAPERLGRGIAVADALLDGGGRADAHDPAVRRTMAASLARLVALCRSFTGFDGLRENLMQMGPNDLWPVPHESRFDFVATAAGAEWIDAIARRALRVRDRDAGDVVVGHADWRVENMRFDGGAVSAVYDWDSLTIQREPVLVGGVAHLFTSDFTAGAEWVQRPTLEEAIAFVADYEAARGVAFAADERASARAALLYAMAYTARCEHSDALTDFGTRPPREPVAAARGTPPGGSAQAFIAAHADDLLA
jgi:Phosphotransferase enzyme family